MISKENGAFEEVFRNTSPLIYSIVYRISGSEEEAKDLTQETFIKAWQRWAQCQNKENPVGWLKQICINIFIDKKRKSAPIVALDDLESDGEFPELVSPIPTAEQEVEADEVIKNIKDGCFTAISTALPLYQRVVFILVDIFSMEIIEVSEIIHRTISSTKALLHRARENMNAFFGTRCSLIAPENICKCKAWLSFVADSESLRESARPDFAVQPDFSDPDYHKKSNPKTMEKVLSLFRTISLRTPSHNWLNEIAIAIKELR